MNISIYPSYLNGNTTRILLKSVQPKARGNKAPEAELPSMEGKIVELDFPLEFVVSGTAVSHQAKRRESVDRWKSRIRDATLGVLPEGHFATGGPVSVTLFYFPESEMVGDIDNIVKPILDALCQHIYIDDDQVERVLVQKFEPEKIFQFGSPSSILEGAIVGDKPLLYVRLSDNPFEELE